MTSDQRNGATTNGDAGLVEAATTLDRELKRHEQLVNALVKCPLDSEKSIARAAELAGEARESQEVVAARVQAMVAAIQAARGRNVASVEAANESITKIDERSAELEALLQRFAGVGRAAHEINDLSTALREAGDEAARSEQLERLLERMLSVRDEARGLEAAAKEQRFADVAKQAESMAQQLSSMHNKLKLLAEKLREGS